MRVRSVIGMPGSPKIVSMPLSLSASMTRWKPSVSRDCALAAVGLVPACGVDSAAAADSVTVAMAFPPASIRPGRMVWRGG